MLIFSRSWRICPKTEHALRSSVASQFLYFVMQHALLDRQLHPPGLFFDGSLMSNRALGRTVVV
jgi:hypothetical protein